MALTHGHRDHAGGASPLFDCLVARGQRRPVLLAPESVPARMDHYRLTDGYGQFVNDRYFDKVTNQDMSEAAARASAETAGVELGE